MIKFLPIILVLVTSCASPNIGKRIPSGAGCLKTVGECSFNKVGYWNFEYTITSELEGYEITGKAVPVGNTAKMGKYFKDLHIYVQLVKDNIVINEIMMAGGDGGMRDTVTFSKKFNSEKFDKTTIRYEMMVWE